MQVQRPCRAGGTLGRPRSSPFAKERWTPIALLLLVSACADPAAPPDEDPGESQPQVEPVGFAVGWLDHVCALDTEGRAWCWGRNSRGQLGNGDTRDQSMPVAVAGDHEFVAIFVGGAKTCGLTDEGVAWCWGSNGTGELGAGWHGDNMFSDVPLRVLSPVPFRSLTLGGAGSCGLSWAGEAYCWGGWNPGGVVIDIPARVETDVRLRTLRRGGARCGLDEGGAWYCWGHYADGRIGSPSAPGDTTYKAPTLVPGGASYESIALVDDVACGATVEGELRCWGTLELRVLGGGKDTEIAKLTPVPERVPAPPGAHDLEDGGCMQTDLGHHCVRSASDPAEALIRTEATPFVSDRSFDRVVDWYGQGCGWMDGELYCWGDNRWGQLGDGTTQRADPLSPVKVAGEHTWMR